MLIAFVLLPAGSCAASSRVWRGDVARPRAPRPSSATSAWPRRRRRYSSPGPAAWPGPPPITRRPSTAAQSSSSSGRIPASSPAPADLKAGGFNANLSTTGSDNRFADLGSTRSAPKATRAYSPEWRDSTRARLSATCSSATGRRGLRAQASRGAHPGRFHVSDWIAPFEIADGSPVPAGQAFAVRYRVRFAD